MDLSNKLESTTGLLHKHYTLMANTYSQIYIQLVFAVKYREALISQSWKHRLHRYISGIVQKQGHKLIAVNSMPDHIHIFVGLKPHAAISDLVRDVKRDSTKFVNEEIRPRFRFGWQEGFGAFSYSRSQVGVVANYIETQEDHHATKTFRAEYQALLREFEVQFDQRYIFKSNGFTG